MGFRVAPAAWVLAALLSCPVQAAAGDNNTTATKSPHGENFDPGKEVFAKVEGDVITLQVYLDYLQFAMRKKFYHGSVPQDRLKSFRREVADELVQRELLLRAARKEGLKAQSSVVEQQLSEVDKRNSGTPDWGKKRENMLAQAREKFEQESLLAQLQRKVQAVDAPAPDDARVKAFYESNAEKFTTPEQVRLSLILLKVDPSAGTAAWNAAREEGERIVQRLRKDPAKFAETARVQSGDSSAQQGGDMGFVHKGMLAPAVYTVIEKMAVGGISDAITLLQGVVIFRLEERIAPKRNAFDEVKARARDLWVRNQQEKTWQEYGERLRKAAHVEYNEAYL